jgi:hypothetical protein
VKNAPLVSEIDYTNLGGASTSIPMTTLAPNLNQNSWTGYGTTWNQASTDITWFFLNKQSYLVKIPYLIMYL